MNAIEHISSCIFEVRGQRVMLDADLARLYGVSTHRLNEQVRRNGNRFPKDFLISLTVEEVRSLRSQFAISKKGRGGRRHAVKAFTEHGAIMAANVLNSPAAIDMSVHIVSFALNTKWGRFPCD